MKILLIGGSGQVGHELARTLPLLGETIVAAREPHLPRWERCDLAEDGSAAALISQVAPDVIVNAAAYTAVDKAESEPALAERINSAAVAEMAKAAEKQGALFVHYSTDYVFAGDASAPYAEDDQVAPASAYGRTKADGETSIHASGCDYFILRTAWVFAARGSNFLRTMLRLGRSGKPLKVVSDQVGAPTLARFLAEATTHMISQANGRASSTYHVSAEGSTTWYDYANYVFQRALGLGLLDELPEVEPVGTDAFPTPARRPAWSVLDNAKVQSDFGIRIPHWQEGVDVCLQDLAESAG